MMKIFLFIVLCALILIAAGAPLVQNANTAQTMFWPNWMEGIEALWIPFIFSFVIVGFGTLALQRINR